MIKRTSNMIAGLVLATTLAASVGPLLANERGDGSPRITTELTSSSAVPSKPSAPHLRTESLPWGIELLICVAGAKLNGASISEAYGQCSAP